MHISHYRYIYHTRIDASSKDYTHDNVLYIHTYTISEIVLEPPLLYMSKYLEHMPPKQFTKG